MASKLTTFPLMLLGAPVVLVTRGSIGVRLTVGLIAAMVAMTALGHHVKSHAVGASPHVAELIRHVSALARTVDTFAEPAAALGVLGIVTAVLARFIAPDRVPDGGSIGSLLGWPLSLFSVLTSAARIAVLWQMAGPQSRLFPRVSVWGPPEAIHLALMLFATLALVGMAHRNDGNLPGWDQPFLGTHGAQPLWRFTARIAGQARRSRDGLGAIFSRRPKDLRAIASGTTPRV